MLHIVFLLHLNYLLDSMTSLSSKSYYTFQFICPNLKYQMHKCKNNLHKYKTKLHKYKTKHYFYTSFIALQHSTDQSPPFSKHTNNKKQSRVNRLILSYNNNMRQYTIRPPLKTHRSQVQHASLGIGKHEGLSNDFLTIHCGWQCCDWHLYYYAFFYSPW